MKVKCFAKLENWHVVEGTFDRFHAIDLSSVLITYVFGNSLIKISFEAKVISSNWKLKTMPSYHSFTAFYKKLTNADVGCFSDEGE